MQVDTNVSEENTDFRILHSTLKMEIVCSSETLIFTYKSTCFLRPKKTNTVIDIII
jgi:hypothetical protein